MARIECEGLCKRFSGKGAPYRMEGLDLEIRDGEVLVVLGPSGCGKSTLLRLIAGLMEPDGGRVLYDGADASDLRAADRGIGMVFQDYALYPNFDSRGNVLSYFLFRKPRAELEAEAAAKYARTAELLGVELEKLMDRMPRNLSGGEKQRVAIGRCITRDPKLFLLDEP
ncbi:MAG: ABC transporter ATP-binding protein, partial [Spirochaetaceae bacterium]|nr:ABC transporter ATP-binding protein [Spirochaetaceae bacterium]